MKEKARKQTHFYAGDMHSTRKTLHRLRCQHKNLLTQKLAAVPEGSEKTEEVKPTDTKKKERPMYYTQHLKLLTCFPLWRITPQQNLCKGNTAEGLTFFSSAVESAASRRSTRENDPASSGSRMAVTSARGDSSSFTRRCRRSLCWPQRNRGNSRAR